MIMNIRIFYSWQSDLPADKTKDIIQSGIDSAISNLKGVASIVADRDTKGVLGSDSIDKIIFEKIQQCDIFVADVSVIDQYASKPAPNPNVLLELGYAAGVIGWENIICVMNTEYGDVESLPFDLRQHRILKFSTIEDKRKDIVKDIKDIVKTYVMDIVDNGPRPKGSNASHVVGVYNFEQGIMVDKLDSLNLWELRWTKNYICNQEAKIRDLIDKINSIQIVEPEPPETKDINLILNDDNSETKEPPQTFVSKLSEANNCSSERLNAITAKYKELQEQHKALQYMNSLKKLEKATISEEDEQIIRDYIANVDDLELSNEFFYLGNLQMDVAHLMGNRDIPEGSDEEIEKYNAIQELAYEIQKLMLLKEYLNTFDNLLVLPLAIHNISGNVDQNLVVSVVIEKGEAILPTRNLINKKISGSQGCIKDLGFIENLFALRETTDVSDRRKKEIDLQQMSYIPTVNPLFESMPDEEDYEYELENYIDSPFSEDNTAYRFEIESLRPNEKSWLGLILIKPDSDGNAKLRYRVLSDNTIGNTEGHLDKKLVD